MSRKKVETKEAKNIEKAEKKVETVKSEPAKKEKTYNSRNGYEVLSRYRGAVMGLSALWIWFFHEWQGVFDGKLKIGNVDIEGYLKTIGFCGVDIFLFLSGIGLVFAIGKGNVFSFYYRRIKRVYLPFLVFGIVRCIMEKWELSSLRDNVLCINFYKVNMYSFLWFVPAILTLYLLFPLYYRIFEKSSNKVAFTGAMFVLWLSLSFWFRDDLRGDLFGFTNRIPVFLFGIYAGWATKNKKEDFTKTSWFVLIVMFLSGLYYAYLANFVGMGFMVQVSNCSIPNLLIACSLPFVLSKCFDKLVNFRYTKYLGIGITKILGFFGLFSLEFYCVQEWTGGKVFEKLNANPPENYAESANFYIFLFSTIFGLILYIACKYFWKLVDFIADKIKAIPKK